MSTCGMRNWKDGQKVSLATCGGMHRPCRQPAAKRTCHRWWQHFTDHCYSDICFLEADFVADTLPELFAGIS